MTQEEKEQAEMLAKLEREKRLATTVSEETSLLHLHCLCLGCLIIAALKHSRNVVWENKSKLVGIDDMCLFLIIILYNQNYIGQLGEEKREC